MAGVLDLFDDEGEDTSGPAAAAPSRVAPPSPAGVHASPEPPQPGPTTPTFRDHPCEVPGCGAWGCYGLFAGDIAASVWRCRAHVWPDFLPGARGRESAPG